MNVRDVVDAAMDAAEPVGEPDVNETAETEQGSTEELVTWIKRMMDEKPEEVMGPTEEYGEMTISEIAFDLNYSSAQYLSNQFKQVTGLTPSGFRNLLRIDRKQLDKV